MKASALKRFFTRKLALLHAAREVRRETGKPLLSQLREIIALRTGPGELLAGDYYAYEVYDDSKYTPAAKREVVSWSRTRLSDTLNDAGWMALCDDKLICYAVLKGLELPIPEIRALYDPSGRSFGPAPCFRTPGEMSRALRRQLTYPLFGKPVRDSLGQGATSLDAYDEERDLLCLADGRQIEVEAYVDEFVTASESGYLLQDRIRPHPDLDDLCGPRVTTLRLIVLNSAEGSRLLRAGWRIPTGDNMVDNYRRGRSGNLLGWIDPDTGSVVRVRGRTAADGDVAFRHLGRLGSPVREHPDTGRRLIGIRLPDWDEVVELCLEAARAFPGLGYQGWDVALSADGPLLIELNFRSFFLQVPGSPGIRDGMLRSFMARNSSEGS